MDLKDLSGYLTSLLRSDAEVVAAFLMGILITSMVVLWLRGRLFAHNPSLGIEFARRDAEIARRDTELARKDAQIAAIERKLAIVESRLLEDETRLAVVRRPVSAPLASDEPPRVERSATLEARCAELHEENLRLRREQQSAEADASDLRAKLAQARADVVHFAKWAKVFEENAEFSELGSLKDGGMC